MDSRWLKDNIAEILCVRGNSEEFKLIKEYLHKRKDTTKIELLSQNQDSMYLRVLTKNKQEFTQFSNLFYQNNCFPFAPTRFEKNEEIWTLATAEKKNITTVYELIRKKHPLRIKSLLQEDFNPKLTTKQQEVLNQAKLFGYYEWPRKTSATKIANLLHMPKTVFLSHLRKAEQKIITCYFQ